MSEPIKVVFKTREIKYMSEDDFKVVLTAALKLYAHAGWQNSPQSRSWKEVLKAIDEGKEIIICPDI